jgi:presenilin-like A22 family membrane protease
MKHNTKVTSLLVCMFLITQLIGLFIVSSYSNGIDLPFGMEPPEEIEETSLAGGLTTIIIAFVIAVLFFFLLMKINAQTFIRLWYLSVTIIALGLSFFVILYKLGINMQLVALLIALPLAYIKVFKRNLYVHNLTELLIYPGIAAVFISFLNNVFGNRVILATAIILLIISLYDMWAVWQSGFMQKMAEFQMNNLKFFTGFFIPYADKKNKAKIKLIKEKYEGNDKKLEENFKKSKIKVNLAILGGGDIIFPIITAGVFYEKFGLNSGILIAITSTIALAGLFLLAKKGKYYPAMPFITAGLYIGMGLSWILF